MSFRVLSNEFSLTQFLLSPRKKKLDGRARFDAIVDRRHSPRSLRRRRPVASRLPARLLARLQYLHHAIAGAAVRLHNVSAELRNETAELLSRERGALCRTAIGRNGRKWRSCRR